jgi:hypothetical protein
MYSISSPKQYRSAFREPCFVVGDVAAASDMTITADGNPVGVKRIYPIGAATINPGPYIRRAFSIEPALRNSLVPFVCAGRSVACQISSGAYRSDTVYLTGGTEDAPVGEILSAAPETVVLRRGEYDEIPFITAGRSVVMNAVFFHDGGERRENLNSQLTDRRMMVMCVSMDLMCLYFTGLTGLDAEHLRRFTLEFTMPAAPEGPEIVIRRNYLFDRSAGSGVRLAWINRYGAIDCHTFPVRSESRVAGSRTRVETPAGYRTVATATEQSTTLLSGPCDERTAEWLAEVFSSPAVWVVSGSSTKRVEVAGGGVDLLPLQPSTVAVTISPASKTVSRKL